MIADYFQRGVVSGVAAGVIYGAYMVFVGNPLTEYLHDAGHDHGHTDDHGHAHEHGQTISESLNFVVSAGSGVLWATLLGGLFAVALYLFEPSLPGSTSAKAYLMAGAGFLSVSVTPWLVLPPAAPGSEHLYAVDARLGIYAGLAVLGAVVSAAAVVAFKRADSRTLGVVSAAVPILAVVIVLPLATPTAVTHPDLAGEVVSVYRALAAFSQAGIWVLIAASFNRLRRDADRSDRENVSDGSLANA